MLQVESLTNYNYSPETMNFAGRADGPVEFIRTLGMEVPTFLDARKDLMPKTQAHRDTLMYHVPPPLRGPYRFSIVGEDVNEQGYAVCMGLSFNGKREHLTGENDFKDCTVRAVNRSGYCLTHGGALHPLDKIVMDWASKPREQQWAAGKLDVSELDDEELARGQIRMANGRWTRAAMVSSAVHDRMVKELFDRADTKLRENLVEAVETMTTIAKGTAYEPADRINAAKWVYERLRGKVPTEIIVTQEKPWEVVMETIVGGSRAESRAAREVENAIDVEFSEGIPEDDFEMDTSKYYEVPPEMGERIRRMTEVDENGNLRHQPDEAYHSEGDIPHPTAPAPSPGFRPAVPEPEPEQEVSPEDLKKAMDRARRKRYAARARGMDVVEVTPYKTSSNPRSGGKAGFVLKFEEPELRAVPSSVLRKEGARRKKDRKER